MPIGTVDGDKLKVITERRDLGYGHGKSGNWWALGAFGAMCDEQIELECPFTLWVFPAGIKLAVERVLKEHGYELTMLTKAEFEREVEEIRKGGKN